MSALMARSSPRTATSLIGLPVVDVGGDDEQHRRRGDADEEREVADVEGPRHLVAHVGGDEARRATWCA